MDPVGSSHSTLAIYMPGRSYRELVRQLRDAGLSPGNVVLSYPLLAPHPAGTLVCLSSLEGPDGWVIKPHLPLAPEYLFQQRLYPVPCDLYADAQKNESNYT